MPSLPSVLADIGQRALRARRELAWVATGQLVALCGAFVGLKVLTNTLGTEKYGQLALGLTIAGLVNLFVYGPINQWVLRFLSIHRERNELGAYFRAVRWVYALATIGVCALAVASTTILSTFLGTEWALLMLAASLFAVVMGANSAFLALQSAVRERKIVALHQGADAWLRPMLALAAMYAFRDSSYFALLGFFAGTLLVTTSQVICAGRSKLLAAFVRSPQLPVREQKRMWQEFFSYVTPFGFFAAFGAISLYGDRWLLQGIFGAREVGIYTAMYQIANAPITLLVGFVSQLMTPVIFDRAGAMTTSAQAERSRRGVYETVGVTSILMLGLSVVAYCFGRPLIAFFTTSEFARHHAALWVLVAGLSLFNLAQLLSLKGFSSRQTQLYVWPKGVQAASFLAFAYPLAKERGVVGVAMALVISSIVYLLLVIRANKYVRIQEA